MSKPEAIQYTGKYANYLLREKDKEIERLRNKINLAICYIEKGKTFRTEETRKEVEYIQNNLLEILDKGEE